ncbi:hypothetical protein B0T22DRAFT_387822, partial [Podospora appendiculata]
SCGPVRRASRTIHECLSKSAWANSMTGSGRHTARLFLDAMAAADGVHMNLAIDCSGHRQGPPSDLITPPRRFQLQVHSRSINALPGPPGPSPRSWSTGLGMSSYKPRTVTPEPGRAQKRLRRVHFEPPEQMQNEGVGGEVECDPPTPPATPEGAEELEGERVPATHHADFDFLEHGDLCANLSRRQAIAKSTAGTCLGHIDCYQDDLRHSFQAVPQSTAVRDEVDSADIFSPGTTVALDQLVGQPIPTRLDVVHQLETAFKVSSAVLKFDQTPWRPDSWGLRNLSFFNQSDDLSSSLETLHLAVEMDGQHGTNQDAASGGDPMDIDPADSESQGNMLSSGIRNVSLWSLGVVLLAIGHWQVVDPSNVVEVRELISKPCQLGNDYRRLAKRVLDCDLGKGDNLRDPMLQRAFCSGVLGKLEGLIGECRIEV